MSGKRPRRNSAKTSQAFSQDMKSLEGSTSNEVVRTPDKKKKGCEDKSKDTKLPTPTRRSARLRGAPVEFSGGEIDQMTRTRSRSRSKSATPTPFASVIEINSNVLSLETINESPPAKRKSEVEAEAEEEPETTEQGNRRSSKGKTIPAKKISPLARSGTVLELYPAVASTIKSPVKIDFNQTEAEEDSEDEVHVCSPSKKKTRTPKQNSQPSSPAVSSLSKSLRSSKNVSSPTIELTSPSSPKKLPKKLKDSIERISAVEESSPSPTKSKKSQSPVKLSPQKQKSSPSKGQETPQQPDNTSPEDNSSKNRKTRESWPPPSLVRSAISNVDTPAESEVASKLSLSNTPTTAVEEDKSLNNEEDQIKEMVENGSFDATPDNKNIESDLQKKSPSEFDEVNEEDDDMKELVQTNSSKASPNKKKSENTQADSSVISEEAESAYLSPSSEKKQKKLEKVDLDLDSTPNKAHKSPSKSPKKTMVGNEGEDESAKSTPVSRKERLSTSTAVSVTPSLVNKTIETPKFKLADPLKQVENHACDNTSQKWPDISSSEELFCSKDELRPTLLGQIKTLYAKTTVQEEMDLPAELVGQHQEILWQQISRKNKSCFKQFKKTKEDLKEALDFCLEKEDEEQDIIEQDQPASELEDELEDKEDGVDEEIDDEENEDAEAEVDEDEGDLFNLREEDLKDLDVKLEELANDGEKDEQSNAKAEKKASRKRKTRNEYEEDILDEETVHNQRKKRFKPSSVDDKFFNLNEMNQFLQEQDKVEEKRRLGKFDGAEEMTELMEGLEEENLQPRSWDLAGEVTAAERGKDELLDHFIDVDFRAKSAPIITTDTTAELEAIIVKRIKDKTFDDVVRKVRQNESLIPLSHRHQQDMQEQLRKSLAEVYEDEFKDKQIESQADELIDPQLDPAVAAINKDLNVLFKKLDALSHYQFTPQEIAPEIKIVSNMPSFRVEEVGPLASTQPDADLLAPEEVLKRVKSAPKAKEERTETDKKRERRHKKKKQKVLAAKGLMNGGEGNDPGTSKEKLQTEVIRGLEKSAESRANAKVFKKKKSVYTKRENKEKKQATEA